MKYLPDDLRNEYEYLLEKNPDIEGLVHPYINISDTLRAYFILAHYFTDPSSDMVETMLIGVRDFNLLASALGRQNTSFGGKTKYKDKIEICATLFFGLVKNHSFSDGNKRTALLILIYQLSLFGYVPAVSKKQFEKLVVSVAANNISDDYANIYKKCMKADDPIVATIAKVLRKMVNKKIHTYHVNPTMREFCDAMEKQNVKYVVNGTTIRFERHVKGSWFKKSEAYCYAIPFSGWTRNVGAETARFTLKNLNLYDQFAGYKDFLEGKESMYQLVDDFSGPLHRLKDK